MLQALLTWHPGREMELLIMPGGYRAARPEENLPSLHPTAYLYCYHILRLPFLKLQEQKSAF